MRHTKAFRTLAPALIASLSACSGRQFEPPDLGANARAIVYGNDDRTDVYAETDTRWKDIARSSVVALLDPNSLVPSSGNTYVVNAPQLSQSAVDDSGLDVCASERFATQPTAAYCSAVLIDTDLVLTAGHCFEEGDPCDQFAYVFDYFYEADGQLAQIDNADVYGCKGIVARELTPDISAPVQVDYTLIQLDRPVSSERSPIPMGTRLPDKRSALTVIGFPTGLPAKIDSGGKVQTVRLDSLDYFSADTDTFGGSSGAPVFDADATLVGFLISGGTDYVEDLASGCLVVNNVEAGQSGGLFEQVAYLRNALTALCDVGWNDGSFCGLALECGDGKCEALTESVANCPRDCQPASDCTGTSCEDGGGPKGSTNGGSSASSTGVGTGFEPSDADAGGLTATPSRKRHKSGCVARPGADSGTLFALLGLLAVFLRRRRLL